MSDDYPQSLLDFADELEIEARVAHQRSLYNVEDRFLAAAKIAREMANMLLQAAFVA